MSEGLELQLGTDRVALRHLVAAAGDFAGLLAEIARSYAGSATAVTWFVEVRKGSVVLPVRGEPAEQIPAPLVAEITDTIAEGLRTLETEAKRPEYFTDRALEQARTLANLASDELPIVIRNSGEPVRITRSLAVHVEEILGPHLISYGTVEGRLEAIQLHGKPATFGVYDALTNDRIECRFSEDVTLEDLRPAIGKRVSVRGEIRRRRNGTIVRIDAHELHVFNNEAELPTPEDVLGILAK